MSPNKQSSGASDTQKSLLVALADGWTLRYVDRRGWCLFPPGWGRPFAEVKERSVRKATDAGWLTPGSMPQGAGFTPAKDLTPLGRKYAAHLIREGWKEGDGEGMHLRLVPSRNDERIEGVIYREAA